MTHNLYVQAARLAKNDDEKKFVKGEVGVTKALLLAQIIGEIEKKPVAK